MDGYGPHMVGRWGCSLKINKLCFVHVRDLTHNNSSHCIFSQVYCAKILVFKNQNFQFVGQLLLFISVFSFTHEKVKKTIESVSIVYLLDRKSVV